MEAQSWLASLRTKAAEATAVLKNDSETHNAKEIDESKLDVKSRKDHAVGIPGVAHAMQHSLREMGPVRTAETLLTLNQAGGYDCMSCAWADPDAAERSPFEFCENGAKAVASEATRKRVKPQLFADYTIDQLREHSDYWLNRQGRLTRPMFKDADSDHYIAVSWERAFDLVAEQLAALDDPDEAIFYTSGRTSNEAAFLYQLFVRGYGTNNLPDCSNMCHESSGTALTETIGIGKGSVPLRDLETAKLIVIAGQNPGTNAPRMLSALEKAKDTGATIVSVNPLPEAGLANYRNPQRPKGVIGKGTPMADIHLQIKLDGDQALFKGIGKVLLEAERAGEHTLSMDHVFDHDFIDRYCSGFDEWTQHLDDTAWEEIETATGLTRAEITEVGRLFLHSNQTVIAWAMGLTQHKNSVPTIKEITNIILSQGNLGRPGAGLLPVRGHSNVQGDRTMGIFERMPAAFHDRIDEEFHFTSPRETGTDVVNAVRAMRDGKAKFFLGMGGNFVKAAPDSDVTESALESCEMTVQVSTKLNHSHFITGKRALILPTLGRTDQDIQRGGPQYVTVEDSMAMVHESIGKLQPPAQDLHSEVAIICHLALALLCDQDGSPKPGTPQVDWVELMNDYSRIRGYIQDVVPGFNDFEERLAVPGGFKLPHPPHDSRTFPTDTGKAKLTVNELYYPEVPAGHVILQSLRSHDQFNTTIYGEDDRYRGIYNGRRVVFLHRDDIAGLGLYNDEMVDIISVWTDGRERRAKDFRVVEYDTARGSAAAYYPETNVLVPLDSTAEGSNTPTSKSVIVRFEPAQQMAAVAG